MSRKINDKNLLKTIKIKMYTDELNDIEDIKDISIQNISLMQHKLNIDLTEIVKLKNLKSISLKFFEITDKVIEAIDQLDFIETIEFSMCIFKNKSILSNKLKSIVIYNCQEFDINMINSNISLEKLQIIHSGIIDITDLKQFKNLKFLKIAHCNVINISSIDMLECLEQLYLNHIEITCDMDIKKMHNLKLISLNGSKVQDQEKYVKKLYEQNKNISIEFEENDLPIE